MTNVTAEKNRKGNEAAAAGTVRTLARLSPKSGERFLDIGANVCFVSNWAASKGCDVLAYEPMPMTNLISKPAPGVKLVQRAVTVDGRDITMQVSKEALDRGYLCSAHTQRRPSSSAESFPGIKSDKIETVLNEFAPDIFKLDIEGGEYEVLPAADVSCARGLFIEIHGCAGKEEALLIPMILKRLQSQGFSPTFGWAKNARFDERSNFRTLVGIGFWREVLFEKSSVPMEGLPALLDGVKRILDSGEAIRHTRCAKEQFDKLVKETL